mmetsp:Transcript_27333/g.59773  ORF Transcript_27333/g.59773 Transcript_27333/m.59773 type:complete len:882 (+) Transcript_27333:6-2651(+)
MDLSEKLSKPLDALVMSLKKPTPINFSLIGERSIPKNDAGAGHKLSGALRQSYSQHQKTIDYDQDSRPARVASQQQISKQGFKSGYGKSYPGSYLQQTDKSNYQVKPSWKGSKADGPRRNPQNISDPGAPLKRSEVQQLAQPSGELTTVNKLTISLDSIIQQQKPRKPTKQAQQQHEGGNERHQEDSEHRPTKSSKKRQEHHDQSKEEEGEQYNTRRIKYQARGEGAQQLPRQRKSYKKFQQPGDDQDVDEGQESGGGHHRQQYKTRTAHNSTRGTRRWIQQPSNEEELEDVEEQQFGQRPGGYKRPGPGREDLSAYNSKRRRVPRPRFGQLDSPMAGGFEEFAAGDEELAGIFDLQQPLLTDLDYPVDPDLLRRPLDQLHPALPPQSYVRRRVTPPTPGHLYDGAGMEALHVLHSGLPQRAALGMPRRSLLESRRDQPTVDDGLLYSDLLDAPLPRPRGMRHAGLHHGEHASPPDFPGLRHGPIPDWDAYEDEEYHAGLAAHYRRRGSHHDDLHNMDDHLDDSFDGPSSDHEVHLQPGVYAQYPSSTVQPGYPARSERAAQRPQSLAYAAKPAGLVPPPARHPGASVSPMQSLAQGQPPMAAPDLPPRLVQQQQAGPYLVPAANGDQGQRRYVLQHGAGAVPHAAAAYARSTGLHVVAGGQPYMPRIQRRSPQQRSNTPDISDDSASQLSDEAGQATSSGHQQLHHSGELRPRSAPGAGAGHLQQQQQQQHVYVPLQGQLVALHQPECWRQAPGSTPASVVLVPVSQQPGGQAIMPEPRPHQLPRPMDNTAVAVQPHVPHMQPPSSMGAMEFIAHCAQMQAQGDGQLPVALQRHAPQNGQLPASGAGHAGAPANAMNPGTAPTSLTAIKRRMHTPIVFSA